MSGPAPLTEIPEAPVPGDGSAEWFTGAGGAKLRAALFRPPGMAKGSVVFSPGRTEPIEKYFEVVGELLARGFVVLIHDWRGQGLSDRLLPDRLAGHAAGYEDFLADYGALLDAFADRLPKPWIAVGLSMGGCFALLAMAAGERRFSGAMFSAPMFGLQTGAMPKPVGRALASLLTRFGAGGMPIYKHRAHPAFEANILTHDRARYARTQAQLAACPDLNLGSPTWGWIVAAIAAMDALEHGPETPRITIPVTVVAAGDERLVDNAAVRRVTARLPGGRYVEIPGAYHEILQETDDVRMVFWREFDDLAGRVAL